MKVYQSIEKRRKMYMTLLKRILKRMKVYEKRMKAYEKRMKSI